MKELNGLSLGTEEMILTESNTPSGIRNIAAKFAIMMATVCGSADKPGDAQEPESVKQVSMLPVSPIAGASTPTLSASEPDRQKIDGWKQQIRSQRLAIAYANIDKADPQNKPSMLAELLKRLKAYLENSISPEESIALRELAFDMAKMCGNFTDALDLHRALESDASLLHPRFINDEIAFLQDALSMGVNQFASRKSAINLALDERRRVLKAIDTLSTDPNDKEANQVIGAYLTLGRYASEAGFPYLAKGTDPALCQLCQPHAVNDPALWQSGESRVNPVHRNFVANRAKKLNEGATGEAQMAEMDHPDVSTTQSATEPSVQVAGKKSVSSTSSPERKGRWIDVLQNGTSPVKNVLAGKPATVTPDGRWLLQPFAPQAGVKLQVPMVPNKDYDLRAEVGNRDGEQKFSFHLPVGKGECSVHFLPGAVSLQPNDGTGVRALPDKIETQLPDKLVIDMKVRSAPGGVYMLSVFVNGKEVAAKTLEESKVNRDWKWVISGSKAGAQSLGISTAASNLELVSLKVHLFDGFRPAVQVSR